MTIEYTPNKNSSLGFWIILHFKFKMIKVETRNAKRSHGNLWLTWSSWKSLLKWAIASDAVYFDFKVSRNKFWNQIINYLRITLSIICRQTVKLVSTNVTSAINFYSIFVRILNACLSVTWIHSIRKYKVFCRHCYTVINLNYFLHLLSTQKLQYHWNEIFSFYLLIIYQSKFLNDIAENSTYLT